MAISLGSTSVLFFPFHRWGKNSVVISSVPNVAHLLDRRPGTQIQLCLIPRYTNTFPVVHASWKKEISWELSFAIWQMPSKDPRLWLTPYVWTYIWCQTPACGFQNSCLIGCFMKRSQIHESVEQDGKPHCTLVCIYIWLGIKLQALSDIWHMIICPIPKFTLALVFTDNQEMWFLPHKRDSLLILFSLQRDCLIVSHNSNLTYL